MESHPSKSASDVLRWRLGDKPMIRTLGRYLDNSLAVKSTDGRSDDRLCLQIMGSGYGRETYRIGNALAVICRIRLSIRTVIQMGLCLLCDPSNHHS